MRVEVNSHVVNDQYQKQMKYCEARPERQLDRFIKPKTPWIYPVSIWATYFDMLYEGERDELMMEAFEHDFERSQMNVFIKNEELTAQIKEILRKFYRKMYFSLFIFLSNNVFSRIRIIKNSIIIYLKNFEIIKTNFFNFLNFLCFILYFYLVVVNL